MRMDVALLKKRFHGDASGWDAYFTSRPPSSDVHFSAPSRK